MKNPEMIQVLKVLNVLFIDELGQISAELLSTLDIILRKIRNNNIFFGGLLIIASMDHRQLPPVTGKPFMMSSHVLSCFKFSVLDHSVRASQDSYLEIIVNIARMHPDLYTDEIIADFEWLLSNKFTHVDSWSDPLITPDVYRIFSKKLPAKESVEKYISQVKHQLNSDQYCERKWKMLSESTMVHGGPYVHEITNGLDKRTNIVNNRERDSNNREQL
jgi:hypothetical protein